MVNHRALTASAIDSREFIAAGRRADAELLAPAGARIAFTGGTDCNDHEAIWAALDKVHAKPNPRGPQAARCRGPLENAAVFRYSKLESIANAISYVPLAAKTHRWLPARRASSRAAAIFDAGRMDLRALSYVAERDGLVTAIADGLRAAGEAAGAFRAGRAGFLVVWPLPVPGP